MSERSRDIEIVSEEGVRIETHVDGAGPALVILPSYGRDGGEDFDALADLVAKAGWTVLRPQPRGARALRVEPATWRGPRPEHPRLVSASPAAAGEQGRR